MLSMQQMLALSYIDLDLLCPMLVTPHYWLGWSWMNRHAYHKSLSLAVLSIVQFNL